MAVRAVERLRLEEQAGQVKFDLAAQNSCWSPVGQQDQSPVDLKAVGDEQRDRPGKTGYEEEEEVVPPVSSEDQAIPVRTVLETALGIARVLVARHQRGPSQLEGQGQE